MTRKKITPVLWCQMGSSPLLLTLLKIQYSTKIQDAGLQQGPSHHSSVLQSNSSTLKVLQNPMVFCLSKASCQTSPSLGTQKHLYVSTVIICTHCHQPYNSLVPKAPTFSGQQYTQTELQFYLKAGQFKGRAKPLTASPACTQPPSLEQENRSWRYNRMHSASPHFPWQKTSLLPHRHGPNRQSRLEVTNIWPSVPSPAPTDKLQDFPQPSMTASEAQVKLQVHHPRVMHNPTMMTEKLWPANHKNLGHSDDRGYRKPAGAKDLTVMTQNSVYGLDYHEPAETQRCKTFRKEQSLCLWKDLYQR